MAATPAPKPRVGDAFGFALLDYLEHSPEARSHFIERDHGLLEAVDTLSAQLDRDINPSGRSRTRAN